jgi:hypothetical protein
MRLQIIGNQMTRFVHDKFAKDYLEELLKPYGKVDTSEKILGEIKEIDVLFTPFPQQTSNLEVLGLLGKFAEYPAILEAFRNPASDDEICDGLQKLLDLRGKLKRRAKAKNIELQDSEMPKLWILTPTISPPKLSGFNVDQKEGWSSGVYFLGDTLRAAIVAIHQLPRTPETLWLRLLGRGTVQEQAIIELQALPLQHFQLLHNKIFLRIPLLLIVFSFECVPHSCRKCCKSSIPKSNVRISLQSTPKSQNKSTIRY